MASDAMNEPSILLELLQALISPPKDGIRDESGKSPDSLRQMLEVQLKKAEDLILKNAKYQIFDTRAEDFCCGTGDIYWRFVGFLLRLLILYINKVEELMPQYEEDVKRLEKLKRTENTAPPMSPDTLGTSQLTTIVSTFQFIACLGFGPALLKGVGVPLSKRSKMMGKVAEPLGSLGREIGDRRLLHCLAVFLECLKAVHLRPIVLTHLCGDVLAALIQLAYAPLPRPKGQKDKTCAVKSDDTPNTGQNATNIESGKGAEDSKGQSDECLTDSYLAWHPESNDPLTINDRRWAREELRSFTRGIPVQPLIRELLVLQGAPPTNTNVPTQKSALVVAPQWLRKYCGFLLSECLMRPHGVKTVLRAFLEDSKDFEVGNKSSSVDWRKCEAVARIIAHCPQQAVSLEHYYAAVGRQVLELLHLKNEVVAKQFVRVAGSAMLAMMELHPQVAMETVMKPLMEPLLVVTSESCLEKGQESSIMVSEDSLTKCVEDLHKVFVTGAAPRSSLVSCLLLTIQPLFKLYVFASSGVLSIRSLCEDLLLVYFKQASVNDAFSCLHYLVFRRKQEDEDNPSHMATMRDCVAFSSGPSGGVMATYVKDRSKDVEIEVESVTKNVSHLLLKLNRAEVTVELFMFLLKRLSSIIKEEVDPQIGTDPAATQNQNGRELLEVTLGTEDVRDNLMVLSLLGHMTEQLGPECFTKTQHIVDFVQVTLERGVTVLKNTEDEMFGAFENETVTMAMGMLTAVMGGAKQLSVEEKTKLKVLLPLLQQLSEQHPDPSIQEMANDLRIAIATHGFILSDSLKQSPERKSAKSTQKVKASDERKGKDTEVKSSKKDKKDKKRPLIEVISSSENAEIPKGDTRKSQHSKEEQNSHTTADRAVGVAEIQSSSTEAITFKKEEKHVADIATFIAERPSNNSEGSQYREAIECLLDPLLPVRGHGLLLLGKLLQKNDAETLRNSEMLLKIFQENVHHEDSYIYLAAVNGLSLLAIHSPDQVLPLLAKCYCQKIKEEKTTMEIAKKKERNVEWRLKLGEALVKTCKALGDLVPAYRDMLVSSCLTVAKDEESLVRASAVSNLGDICKLLRFSLGNIVFQVLDCVSALLKSDPDAEVRKSAAMFTTLLLQGLGKDALKVLEEALRDLYRLLKMTLTLEKEEMVCVHVQLTLDELDSIMREFLFPKLNLTKHIYVADAPPN